MTRSPEGSVNLENGPRHPTTLSRRRFLAGSTFALAGLPVLASGTWADAGDEISRTAGSIHQERSFAASRPRIYDALTVTAQFDHVVRLGEAMRTGMKLGARPTEIHNEAGGTFTLFGGHITGRFVELVRDARIVQAWRVANWDPGIYSIAKYELSDAGTGTKLVFDHTGFPTGEADHLAEGWISNYWQPLAQYLAQVDHAHK
jgi:uncharacterized protein YndB with AHSA1/START domain